MLEPSTSSSALPNTSHLPNNRPLSEHEQLLIRVSWLYYIAEYTQQKIADRMGLSRIKVNRLLQQAKDTGIVDIRINGVNATYIDLEQQLCERYDLKDAVVVEDASTDEARYRSLAKGLANWLMPRLSPDIKVGLSIGRTLARLPDALQPMSSNSLFVEVMSGAGSHTGSFEKYNVTSRVAEITGGRASYFHAPTVVSSRELKQSLLKEKMMKEAFQHARACDITLQSAGSIKDGALLRQYGYISDADLKKLRANGAVGDILGTYINAEGKAVKSPLDGRVMAMSLEDLKAIPFSVSVGGLDKAEVFAAALKGKIFNVLITDHATALTLLND